MKAFLIACLAVAVMAEADPNLILANGLYNPIMPVISSPLVQPVTYINPMMKTQEVKDAEVVEKVAEEKKVELRQPIVYSTGSIYNPLAVPYVANVHLGPRYVSKNGEVEHIVHKREADPLTVISPYASAAYPFMYSHMPAVYSNQAKFINPYTMTTVGEVTNDAVLPTSYAAKGQYVARAPGTNTVHIAKREADPLTVISPYASAAYPFMYSHMPAVYSNQAKFVNPYTMTTVGEVTNDAVLPTNYASKGQYVARAPGSNTVHIAKREADPLTLLPSPMVYGVPSMMYSHVNPIVYTPNVITKSIAEPIESNPLGSEGVVNGKTVADDAYQFTPLYAGKGTYVAKTPGSTHVAKREADPLTIVRTPSFYTNGFLPTVVRPSVYTYGARPIATPFVHYY